MILNIIFICSGLIIVTLIGAKVIEDKKKSKPFILRLISLGDERVKHLSEDIEHKYAELKERVIFFVQKQIPLHTKNLTNKTVLVLKEKTGKYVGDIRGSKFLKKNDGISEFFKNISEKENGGRIDSEVIESKSEVENKE